MDIQIKNEEVVSSADAASSSENADQSQSAFKVPLVDTDVKPSSSSSESALKEESPSPGPPPLPYTEPPWACTPSSDYHLEVVKNGTVINRIDLSLKTPGLFGKTFYVIGRLPDVCDICAEHPTCSRYHGVIQFGKMTDELEGFYLYDLKSTHGTFLNKVRVTAEKYERLHVGHVIKFGSSTRLYIVQGPTGDEEEESGMSVTEMKAAREAEIEKMKAQKSGKESATEKETDDSGVDWGFGPDAVDEAPDKDVGFLGLTTGDDAYYADDPAKALKAFFVREGTEMEHDIEEVGQGRKRQFHCTIPLPIETPNGRQMVAEATVDGKKKDALAAAILEACRILHAKGILKGTTQIGRQRKSRNWADEDFYDSDEDAFLDRTGTVEKKRQERIQRSGKVDQQAETYESLTKHHEDLKAEIQDITERLHKAEENKKASMGSGSLDDLDNFMDAIKNGLVMDPKTKIKLRQRVTELKQEEIKLVKLINLTKPLDLPPVMPTFAGTIGAIEKEDAAYHGRFKAAPLPPQKAPVFHHEQDKVVVEEEDETEDPAGNSQTKPPESSNKSTASMTPRIDAHSSQSSETTSAEDSGSARKRPNLAAAVETSVVASATLDNVQPYIQPSKKRKPDSRNAKAKFDYDTSDPDYAMWLPPEDQAGDGKISLNEKLGY